MVPSLFFYYLYKNEDKKNNDKYTDYNCYRNIMYLSLHNDEISREKGS